MKMKTKLIVSLLMILTMMMPAMSVQVAQTIYNNETGVHDAIIMSCGKIPEILV